MTHMGSSVHVLGQFEVLRNGVTLVDLPGHGDTNSERYLLSASPLFLRIRTEPYTQ